MTPARWLLLRRGGTRLGQGGQLSISTFEKPDAPVGSQSSPAVAKLNLGMAIAAQKTYNGHGITGSDAGTHNTYFLSKNQAVAAKSNCWPIGTRKPMRMGEGARRRRRMCSTSRGQKAKQRAHTRNQRRATQTETPAYGENPKKKHL